jgi:hypothetical protein
MLKSMQQENPPVSREQLRQQIEQSVRDAEVAAGKAAREATEQALGGERIIVRPPPQIVTTVGVPARGENQIPPEAENIAFGFFIMVAAIIIGYPLMRAIAKRIERGAPHPAQIPNDVRDQLQQISASVDAIAIEVERVSEGQRFTTKMLTDRSRDGTILTPGAPQ